LFTRKSSTIVGSSTVIAGSGSAVATETIAAYERELAAYTLEKLSSIQGIQLYGPKEVKDRLAVFSFGISNIHAHDVAEVLNRQHIAVRSGHHCAQPLMACLGVSGTARASFYIYNTKEDVDRLVEGIEEVKRVFKSIEYRV
jgi:cysteine desulfurase/selenocysteine lyase